MTSSATPWCSVPARSTPLDRPSERLGGARVRAKREDCDSGPVFGGDKTREQE